jgi:hypothetical protein
MTERSEIVWSPRDHDFIAVVPVKIRGRKAFLRRQNPHTFRGNETPRMAESRGIFAKGSTSAFGKTRSPDGDFPQWAGVREEYAKTRLTAPRQSQAAEEQDYLLSILEQKLGPDETRLFLRSATDPWVIHFSTPEELSLVRNRVVPPPFPKTRVVPAPFPKAELRRSEQIPL